MEYAGALARLLDRGQSTVDALSVGDLRGIRFVLARCAAGLGIEPNADG